MGHSFSEKECHKHLGWMFERLCELQKMFLDENIRQHFPMNKWASLYVSARGLRMTIYVFASRNRMYVISPLMLLLLLLLMIFGFASFAFKRVFANFVWNSKSIQKKAEGSG